jgi:hypothetical protein
VLSGLEIVEIQISPKGDLMFEEIKHRLSRRIEVRIEIDNESLMGRQDVLRKGFAEPTLDERHAGIIDHWNGTVHRKVPLLKTEISRFR